MSPIYSQNIPIGKENWAMQQPQNIQTFTFTFNPTRINPNHWLTPLLPKTQIPAASQGQSA
jgi:hypothetical protein